MLTSSTSAPVAPLPSTASEWLTQLRWQCLNLLRHPQLNTREAMYALGTLMSKVQQCIDEGRIYPGLIAGIGQGLNTLIEQGCLQQQARQLMPVPWFRDEARQQIAILWTIFPKNSLPGVERCLTGSPGDEPCWHPRVEGELETLQRGLILSLVENPAFFAPRYSLGELFARLSRSLFWFRLAALKGYDRDAPSLHQQRCHLQAQFKRCGLEIVMAGESEGMTSDFYLLKGLALL